MSALNKKLRSPILGLQFLRGFAAVAVVVDHAAATVASPKYYSAEFLGGFLYHGAVGVDVFFLISGFIITIVSLDGAWSPKLKIGQFASRRFWRIVPLMWIAVLSFLALKLVGRGSADFSSFWRALVLSPIGALEPVNIWTLRHELIFYAVFAITMLGPKVLRPGLIVWGLSPFALMLFEANELTTKVGYATNVQFCCGVLLGLLWLKRPSSIHFPVHPIHITLTSMLILMCAAELMGNDFGNVFNMAMMAILIAPLLWVAIVAECPPGYLTNVGSLLGDASYSIYLFHPHLLTVSGSLMVISAPSLHPSLSLIILILLSIGGGIAAHLCLEKPLLTLLQRPRKGLNQTGPRSKASTKALPPKPTEISRAD